MKNKFLQKNKKIQQRAGKNFSDNAGFTLIEMLVSIALFTIVIVISVSSIITTIDVNRKSQSLTTVMTDLNFALESMTRTIKTATKVTVSNGEYTFRDQRGDFVRYVHVGQAIQRCTSSGQTEQCIQMTSTQTEIDNFSLTAIPAVFSGQSYSQPRFLMNVSGVARVGPNISSDYNIQTTVTPRTINFADNFAN
ncbi:MAG TPA: prepilin-type N-terminal cleavage/methylation domain-containing protein [Candidatus Paceibacterota bacterium]|nr:prepilin-type N-terminal cleavage/methylation domain-containing protein [Candidatus Paceibacterota bacterium]